MGKTLWCILAIVLAGVPAIAQRNRLPLPGHVSPRARAANDVGTLDPSTQLQHLTILLKGSDAQQVDLEQFLAAQQDPSSPDFHRWLTPEQYAQRFGVRQSDVDAVTAWLTAQGLTVDSVSRARTVVAFSGSVGAIEKAFGTELHRFDTNGEVHFANVSDPTLPALLANVVAAVHGLHDFRLRPASLKRRYTSASGGVHYLAPDDVATIYDIRPLYSSGIDGTNQKIAVVGQTQLPLADIRQFRTYFNLPPNDPQVTLVPNTTDPGVTDGDLTEADLDVEWAGAIARNAKVSYIYSNDVTDALYYAIDQNIAPVISMSYGLCESDTGQADLITLRRYAQQANTQGITWLAASGDSGANDCYASSPRSSGTLSVDAPASLPEVTGIGGTTLTEGSGTYWSINDANHASALSYIPESVWNDSATDGMPSSSGGGASAFFAKPSWQTGAGVPADGWRDVPDISLSASANHDGYLVYSAGSLILIGGTSAGVPAFAGVVALLNQYLVANGLQKSAGAGNINPRLYSLAQGAPAAFHDIVYGDNIVSSCAQRSRGGCTSPAIGYKAGVGYDLATGLGSVDVYNLVTGWSTGVAVKPVVSLLAQSTAGSDGIRFTFAVTASDGGTPTGTVSFSQDGATLGVATLPASALPGVFAISGSPVTATYTGNYPSVTVSISPVLIAAVTSAASFRQVYAPGMIASVFGSNLATRTESAPGLPLPVTLGGATVMVNGIPALLYYASPGQINFQVPPAITSGSTAIVNIASGGQNVTGRFEVAAVAPAIFLDNGGLPGYPFAARGQTIAMYITGDGGLSGFRVSTAGLTSAITYAGVPSWSVGVTQINFTVPATAPVGLQPVTVTVGGVTSGSAMLNITP